MTFGLTAWACFFCVPASHGAAIALCYAQEGAEVVVGDLDEDGLPEIVSSSASLDRRADQLLVRTLTDNGQLRERLRIPVPSGIDSLAICPSDGRAMAPLALATGDGIWLIR